MATIILEYGPAAAEMIRVGLLGELRYDVDNDSLRVHDGVKEGGFEFLNRDQNDGRYQARSLELDGFDFGAQGKGILTRVGPAQYKLRKLTSDSGDLTYNDPRGTSDDFDIRISDTVTTEHTWEAPQTFESAINATEAGLDGETRGEHVGHVTGDVTGDLTGDAHGNHDGTFTGDVDVRGKQFVTDDGQILEEQIDPEAWIRRGLPLGAIVMWSGTVDSIPASFHLCDGQGGTPDLRNRFIFGAGSGVGITAPGATGGSSTAGGSGVISPAGGHTHDVTVAAHTLTIAEIPSHTHEVGVDGGEGDGGSGSQIESGQGASLLTQESESAGGGGSHSHPGSTAASSGEHTHELTLDNVTIMPPYFALCYIQKIA